MNEQETTPSDIKEIEHFYYTAHHIKHPRVKVGEHTYGWPAMILAPGTYINIGNYCSMGANVKFEINSEHRTSCISTYPFPCIYSKWPGAAHIPTSDVITNKGDVNVGNDVWIGTGVTILGGVTIGDGAIIGAYSLVTKDVSPYSIVGGNPIREIRKRFSDDIIEKLLEIKWWDWPVEKVNKYAAILSSCDIEKILEIGRE